MDMASVLGSILGTVLDYKSDLSYDPFHNSFQNPKVDTRIQTQRKSLPLQLTLEEVLAVLTGLAGKTGIYYVLGLGGPGGLSKYTNKPYKPDNNRIYPIINMLTETP